MKKVLIPLDGSRLSDAVIPHVRRLLFREATAWKVHLLSVIDRKETRMEARAEARAHLAACERLLRPESFLVRSHVVVGDPAEEILEHAVNEEADLVAIATHGRTGLRRWVRGSVAERVLRGCSTSLLLVNPHGLLLENDDVRYRRILVPTGGPAEVVTRLSAASGAEIVPVEPGDDAAAATLEAARACEPDLIAITASPRTALSPWPLERTVERITRAAPCPVLLLRGALLGAPRA
jgi:nucleotide-binding universal stress UspA family protein